ncbi:MAG TPA: hypothetical protein VHC69_13260 [Polyangiaceae bacterium]|nr:hypothetical protein [Polyangiaceae bacterium]
MKTRAFIGYAFAALLLSAGCDSDHVENNPSFTTGSGGTRSRDAGLDAAPPSTTGGARTTDASTGAGGAGDGSVADASSSAGGNPADAGSSGGVPGAGGTPADAEPPYDCVLNPRTHAEIINACTDAVRIEKHPMLPAISN